MQKNPANNSKKVTANQSKLGNTTKIHWKFSNIHLPNFKPLNFLY